MVSYDSYVLGISMEEEGEHSVNTGRSERQIVTSGLCFWCSSERGADIFSIKTTTWFETDLKNEVVLL